MSDVGLYAVSPIPEVSPLSDKSASIDPLSALCQQVSQGMSLLTSADDAFPNLNDVSYHIKFGAFEAIFNSLVSFSHQRARFLLA